MNYLYITKNDQNSIIKLKRQLKRKFGLNVRYNKESSELIINRFKINLWEDKRRFIFLDSMDSERSNCDYFRSIMTNVGYSYKDFGCFAMIKSYVEQYLASINNTKIRSEGAGNYLPFSYPILFSNSLLLSSYLTLLH